MTRTLGYSFALLLALGAVGCGSDSSPSEAAADSAGGEVVTPEPEVVTGPTRSYVTDAHTVVMRLDMERVRSSAVSADIASLVRSYPLWQQLLGASGIDPVRDFDRVLVSSATASSDQGMMLIHHHLSPEQVRESVLQMAVDRGTQPEWRQVDDFDVVDWPAETDPPRVVVLTGPQELVVTTAAGLDAVIEVAHDHRLRRQAEEVVEPALQLDDRVIATVLATELSDRYRARIQHPPQRIELELRDHAEEAGRMELAARGAYADAAAAEAARTWVTSERDFYAGQMLVRAVGLNRPLEEATIAVDGSDLVVDASFTEEEVQRVLGLLAFAQIGTGG